MTQNEYLRISENVDQVELEAIRLGSSTLSTSINDETISGELDDEVDSMLPEHAEWAIEDEVTDTDVGNVRLEIQKRKSLLGDLYPFNLNENSLGYSVSPTLVYELCLCITQSPSITEGEYVKLPRFFELITAELVKNYFNANKYWHTGWPNSTGNIKNHFEIIDSETCEWKWQPAEYVETTNIKDHGIDFVIWKHLPGSMNGSFYNLGQCACGNNWNSKFKDLSLDKLSQIVKLPPVQPIFSFATPRQISRSDLIAKVSSEAGLFFERSRLTLLSRYNDIDVSNYNSDIQSLIDLVIAS